jgi:putative transposase
MRLLTGTHAKRWHGWRGTTGTGAVYQARFKSLPVQTNRHFYNVCRYVEQNAFRAGLVDRAQDWQWSSLAQRYNNFNRVSLEKWPILQPDDWLEFVNHLPAGDEVRRLRRAVAKGTPIGDAEWTAETASTLRLETSLRPRGRPPKWGAGASGAHLPENGKKDTRRLF